jgi:hypothetical protein
MISIEGNSIALSIDLHSQAYVNPPDALHSLIDVLGYPVGIRLLIGPSSAVGLLDCLQVIDHPYGEFASISGLIPREGDLIEEGTELGEVLPEEDLELAVVLSIAGVLAEWERRDFSERRV